jgi:hypothetical protein
LNEGFFCGQKSFKITKTIKNGLVCQRAINPDFESLRTALMNSYNSQTTNHVAVVVALTVGIFILISTKDFRDLYKSYRKLFLFVLSLPISLIAYFAYRMIFWAFMSSEVLTVTENEAIHNESAGAPTVISGIQTYLTNYLSNHVHTLSSTLYQLDQKQFGASFILLLVLTFSLIYISFGFYSEYYDAKNDTLSCDAKRNKWYELNRAKIQWLKNALKKRSMKIEISVLIAVGLILFILTYF